jgi:hypothetical protein
VRTRRGLTLLPDDAGAHAAADRVLAPVSGEHPARALDLALGDIGRRYGDPTAAFVALQLEYPTP